MSGTMVREISRNQARKPGHGAHSSRRQVSEEKWIPTVCTMCYNVCSIQVLVRDGVATAIEGLPGAPPNYGKMCAKGKAALAGLYSPRRVTRPLKRTNPEKGIGVDPRWVEISWEEALDTVSGRIRSALQRDKGVSIMSFDNAPTHTIMAAFLTACGGMGYSSAVPNGVNLFCGRGVHPVALMVNGSTDKQPDYAYCKYLLVLGGGFGTGTGTHAMAFARELADARVKNGLKMVVVDPCKTSSGGRADEWVPIVPGTDAALCLAIANILVNELGVYDEEFLKSYTNSAYLIRPDGHYARDAASGKPLVLSVPAEGPAPYDSVEPADVVLEGDSEVGGQRVQTAFALLREHLKQYTAEYASEVTTIGADVIRRMAKELGEAASIGATVDVEGVDLPLRPVCVVWYRGLGQHQHGLRNGWAAAMLNVLVGAVDVPGGYCGTETTGPWGLPYDGVDGLLEASNPWSMRRSIPYRPARFDPKDPGLTDMFPVSITTSVMSGLTYKDPQRFNADPNIDVWICSRSNPMKSAGDPGDTAEILKKIPFQVSFVQHHEETSQFADVVLPDTHYLERLAPHTRDSFTRFQHSPSPHDTQWTFSMQQPVVQPMGQARNWLEVIWELAQRAGIERDFYTALNLTLKLEGDHRLDPNRTNSYVEFANKWLRAWCGEEHGLDYFRDHGWAAAPQNREVRHRYPRVFHRGRIPLYLEHWLTARESLDEIIEKEDIEWGDLSDYDPLVRYSPCWASREGGDDFPMYLQSPKVGFLTLSTSTIKNPHLQELSWATGEIFNAGIHPSAARDLGIQTGDLIEVESANGRRTAIKARVTPDVHPNVVSAPGNVAKVLSPDEKAEVGEGVHLNSFLPYQLERVDLVSGALDTCLKVRIRKIRGVRTHQES